MFHHYKRAAGVSLTMALAATLAVSAPAFSAGDVTSAKEKARVDAVATPELDWYKCYPGLGDLRCATVKLPMDYDNPNGAQVELALIKHVAAKPNKIGTMFVNPGGPGGSGTETAAFAGYTYSQEVLDRFDIVGFDPRGIAFSDNVKCFESTKDQLAAMGGMNVPFPFTAAEKTAYKRSAAQLGFNCALNGRPLAASMSTAEVARDMDVLRRAVGDQKLTYFGWSYGTYLGQVYANMFPDRVRAMVIDGVVDPVSWAGTSATQGTPVTLRIRSAEGAQKALDKALALCDAAGTDYCLNAGHAKQNYLAAVAKLKAKPLKLLDIDGSTYDYTYAMFVADLLGTLYAQSYAPETVDGLINMVLTSKDATGTAQRTALKRLQALRTTLAAKTAAPKGFGFPYDNGFEAFSAVLCTDSLNAYSPGVWNGQIEARVKSGGGDFARAWGWESVQCARQYWTSRDEDAYRGPFTKTTANPVLVVGDYYDPATNYDSAVKASKLLPNSRLLSSESWGHTAYGTSTCATKSIDNYLLKKTLPAKGTTCTGDYKPFQDKLVTEDPSSSQAAPAKLKVSLPVRMSGLPTLSDR